MKVLQISAHYQPNVGGLETHLTDLVNSLVKRNYQVFVLTYTPLTTKKQAKVFESGKNLTILRIPWMGGFFYSLVNYPILEFIYLLPGLFVVTPIIISRFDVIHAHGLVAGFAAVFWGKLFRKKVIISTHSVYSFPKKGIYRNFAHWIFNRANFCLCLSKKSQKELISLDIRENRVSTFTYWIDLNKFKNIKNAKKILNLKDNFTALFVGRLIREKGIIELLESAKKWSKKIKLLIIGLGSLQYETEKASLETNKIKVIGSVTQDKLPLYYSASDVLIVPSISEEGFGRVILESLACGTPVIASNRGGISEAVNESVGKQINITPKNIKDAVEYFANNKNDLNELAKNCRKYTERRYSEKNVETIIGAYQK